MFDGHVRRHTGAGKKRDELVKKALVLSVAARVVAGSSSPVVFAASAALLRNRK